MTIQNRKLLDHGTTGIFAPAAAANCWVPPCRVDFVAGRPHPNTKKTAFSFMAHFWANAVRQKDSFPVVGFLDQLGDTGKTTGFRGP